MKMIYLCLAMALLSVFCVAFMLGLDVHGQHELAGFFGGLGVLAAICSLVAVLKAKVQP